MRSPSRSPRASAGRSAVRAAAFAPRPTSPPGARQGALPGGCRPSGFRGLIGFHEHQRPFGLAPWLPLRSVIAARQASADHDLGDVATANPHLTYVAPISIVTGAFDRHRVTTQQLA